MPCPLARPASVTAPTSGSRGLASGSHQRPPPSRAGHPAHSCGARVVATSQRPQEAQAWGPEWWTRGAVGVRGGRLAPTACARRAGGGLTGACGRQPELFSRGAFCPRPSRPRLAPGTGPRPQPRQAREPRHALAPRASLHPATSPAPCRPRWGTRRGAHGPALSRACGPPSARVPADPALRHARDPGLPAASGSGPSVGCWRSLLRGLPHPTCWGPGASCALHPPARPPGPHLLGPASTC